MARMSPGDSDGCAYCQACHIRDMPWRKLTREELDAKLRALGYKSLAELRQGGATDEDIEKILSGAAPQPDRTPKPPKEPDDQ
jgi:hypothetical protein